MENPFVKLFAIDFKDHLEVKKSGNTELKYVSWAYAWAEVKKLYPSASYEVKKFNGLPYVYDPITGFMVYTSVTIEGVSHEMWLPVLDGANKAMKAVPYTYTTPKWDYNPQTRRREKVGMEIAHLAQEPVCRLSGGQKQLVFMAQAFVAKPKVLLLDEPCSALDPISTARIEELIDELKKDYTVVIVTHSMQQAARVSDYTAFMYLGELIEFGPTKEIFTRPRKKATEDYITGRFG